MDNYIIPAFDDTDIDEIKRPEAQAFFNRLLKDLKPSSVAKIKIIFSGFVNLAEDDQAITKYPIRRFRLPIAEEPDKSAPVAQLVHSAV